MDEHDFTLATHVRHSTRFSRCRIHFAGADVPVGTIHVTWKDSGRAPPIADLTAYTLNLMVGGNEQGNMVRLLK